MVEHTLDFRQVLYRCRYNSYIRQLYYFHFLLSELNNIANNNSFFAILLRGSLARGDFCSHSDIDLVVLNKNKGLKEINILVSQIDQIASRIDRRISVDTWDEKTMAIRKQSLRFWLGVIEARFLMGNFGYYTYHFNKSLTYLLKMSFSNLFEIRRMDRRRHWDCNYQHSSLGLNIKRAEGGILDADFLNLISFISKYNS